MLQVDERMFTLKSGGHSAAGLSVADDVLLVDLSGLRGVIVDRSSGTVRVEPGTLMKDLDVATSHHGMATTGGTVSHTGVVGLALGGGLGWLMGSLGLACDNVVHLTIVRNGEVIAIDESSQLMRFARGYGTQLGLIVSMTLRLHPIPPLFLWTSIALSRDESLRGFQVFQSLVEDIPDAVGCSFSISGDVSGLISGIVDVVMPANDRACLAWLGRLRQWVVGHGVELVSDYVGIQQNLDSSFAFGGRSYRRSACVDEVSNGCVEAAIRHLARIDPLKRTITFDVLHGQALDQSRADESSFVRRRFVALMTCSWTDKSMDSRGRDAGRDLFSLFREAHGATLHTYGNYSSHVGDSIASASGNSPGI